MINIKVGTIAIDSNYSPIERVNIEVVEKVFNVLAKRYEGRNGGYTRIIKLDERKGDDALVVMLSLV